MRILVHFQFQDEPEPAALTGVEGTITDMILPSVGDLVRHADFQGVKVLGRVKERIYVYDLHQGIDIDGTVAVTVLLEKVTVN